ncbi:hypothetical protein [Rhodoflexus caldus]|uniref:hypothetical protein n=1 Tax=Rhodoflexus caldus TaxID=2891236 RepID=UPI00202AB7AB|nr:hypothetical protein [Rhodoflexus caldus]
MSKTAPKKETTKVHWDFEKPLLRNIRVVALKAGVSPAEYVQEVMRQHLASLPPIDFKAAIEEQDTYKGVELPY